MLSETLIYSKNEGKRMGGTSFSIAELATAVDLSGIVDLTEAYRYLYFLESIMNNSDSYTENRWRLNAVDWSWMLRSLFFQAAAANSCLLLLVSSCERQNLLDYTIE